MSVPLLGERVDAGRWAAIVVGLAGVLLVWRPTGPAR
jgi:drug/metabolite transporter (DMT)-like permease